MSETSKCYRGVRPDTLSSFLPPGIPWSAVRSRHPTMSKGELVYSHIGRRQLSFSLGALFVSYTIIRLWIITHPPLFQRLSSPLRNPLDIVTKTHRGGFFLLGPLLFPLPRHCGAGGCTLGSGRCNGVSGAAGGLMAQSFAWLAQWLQHSLNRGNTVIILTPVVNVANHFWLSKQPPQCWLASLRFLLKPPLSAANFLSISSRLAQTTSPHTCDCIGEKRPK